MIDLEAPVYPINLSPLRLSRNPVTTLQITTHNHLISHRCWIIPLILTFRGSVTHLGGKVTHLGGKVTHLGGTVTHIGGKVTHLGGKVLRLGGTVTHLGGTVTQLGGTVIRLGSTVTHLGKHRTQQYHKQMCYQGLVVHYT